jgi:transposase
MAPSFNLDPVSGILDELDPPQRTRKLSNREVLETACFVLSTGIPWKNTGSSFSAAYKRFRHWATSGMLQRAWVVLLGRYSERQLRANPGWFKDLFIDSTQVKNVRGVDCVGRNPTDRGRYGTKMSVICDHNQVPLACLYSGSNTSDVKLALPTVNSIPCPVSLDGRRRCNIVGDKGYVSADLKAQLEKLKLRLVTDNKKGCRQRRITKADRLRLTARHKIENTFCRLDQFARIRNRLECSVVSFAAFNSLAFILITIRNTKG